MSRMPPPPAAFSGNRPSGQYGGGDSYRPQSDSYNDRRQDENRPPYPKGPPPPPMFEFRGRAEYQSRSSYDRRSPPRQNYDYAAAPGIDAYRPRDNDFTFRHDAPPSMDFNRRERDGDHYRPRSLSPPRPLSRRNNYGDGPTGHFPSTRQNQYGRGGERGSQNAPRYNDYARPGRGGYRGRGGHRGASDRAFLKTTRAPTPELMPGIIEDKGPGNRYRPIEEMSDSDEAEMSLSENESDDQAQEPRKKQARTEATAADGDSVPRWSNPDPYTALPPPDESQRKKKDVVKLIRKARVTSTENTTKAKAVIDDFISFDFNDEELTGDQYTPGDERGIGVPGAPTGPRPREKEVTRDEQLLRDDTRAREEVVLPPPPKGPREAVHMQTKLAKAPLGSLPPKPVITMDLASDPALGNRKRTIRDELKGPPRIYGALKGKRGPSDGQIASSWKVPTGSTGTPWIDIDHSNSANMGLWMHKEIIDFYHYVKPRHFEEVIRSKLIDDLRISVAKRYSDVEILPFGSFPAGLYLPVSDMDLVCVSNDYMRTGWPKYKNRDLWKFADFLKYQNIPLEGSVEVIPKAKVPLVKYIDRITGLRVDISFENDTGLIANKTFQAWKIEFPAMPILVTLIKHVLAMRGLNEPANGGIGGFSVMCLVVSLLQQMPQIQSRSMIPEHHLGEVLMEFFDLYGNQFNFATTAISVKPPAYVPKSRLSNMAYKGGAAKISILDPNRPDNDISGGASNTSKVLECFSNAYRDSQKRMGDLQYLEDRGCQSILGCILGGNYSSFELQRGHLAHVHEILIGPIRDT